MPARWRIDNYSALGAKMGHLKEEGVHSNGLQTTYESSLRLAVEVAFPAISAGAYAYPLKLATEVAIASVRGFLTECGDFDEIIFCCYSGEDFATYERALSK